MGKDNITFHAQIWPAELLGYAGLGDKDGSAGSYGVLNLPTEVVASEFMTMEGKQFSTSRGHVIYVRDVLDRYGPDPLRYFICAAGPENQDSDFTWAEFVRRNNDELVANWGNLVNRTLTSAHKNFGAVPTPGPLTDEDIAVLAAVEGGFGAVGDQIEKARFKAALGEALQLATRVNQYVSEQAPWAVIKEDRERAGTILYVALRCVDNLKTLFAPFLPFSSQALHELLGHEGYLAGPLLFEEVEEADGARHTVLTGRYATWCGRWEATQLPVGQALAEPRPLFRKLDPDTVVAEELARMERSAPA
jgi:methionyl-tRNA synthetase